MKSTNASSFLQQYGATLALPVALAATLGSLYFSEVAHFIPCTMCWYQRILMYPLAVIILVGLIEQDEFLPKYVLPLSITGLFVSSYHYLLQWGVLGNSAACTVGVPCNVRYISWLGFITIPFMALAAFTLITLIMLATRQAYAQADANL